MFKIMTSTVVVGGFFGDEGKGKIISYLAIKDDPKIIVRGGAGPNAGHTIMDGEKVYKVRMLPSGFLNKTAKVMIGPGVVINPSVLLKEIQDFDASGRTFILLCLYSSKFSLTCISLRVFVEWCTSSFKSCCQPQWIRGPFSK